MGFFHEMLDHKAKTKMTSGNLAIIIAPNILRCRVESVQQIMRDAPHVQSVIRCMIDDYPSLFEVRCRPSDPAPRRRNISSCDSLLARNRSSPPSAAGPCTI